MASGSSQCPLTQTFHTSGCDGAGQAADAYCQGRDGSRGEVNDSELDNFTGEMLRGAGFSESQQTFTTWIWGRSLVKAEATV